MKRILCVCLGNTCRSPMFEVLLRQAIEEAGHGSRVSVESAGIMQEVAGKPANEKSLICMGRIGLNLKDHRSRWIGNLDMSQYDTVLCVEPTVVEAIQTSGITPAAQVILVNEPEGVKNPYGKDQAAYDECAAIITTVVRNMVGELVT